MQCIAFPRTGAPLVLESKTLPQAFLTIGPTALENRFILAMFFVKRGLLRVAQGNIPHSDAD